MSSGTYLGQDGNRSTSGPIGLFVDWMSDWGSTVIDSLTTLGDLVLFASRTFSWLTSRLPRKEALLPNFYQVGVLSLPVVALTGTFIGMILALLGRQNVAILLKAQDKMERPSDIQGLIYIPFKDDITEAALPLAKEMNAQGLRIDLCKL